MCDVFFALFVCLQRSDADLLFTWKSHSYVVDLSQKSGIFRRAQNIGEKCEFDNKSREFGYSKIEKTYLSKRIQNS